MIDSEQLLVYVKEVGSYERWICQFPNRTGRLQRVPVELIPSVINETDMHGRGIVITRQGEMEAPCLGVYVGEDLSEILADVLSPFLREVMILTCPHNPLSMSEVQYLAQQLRWFLDQTPYMMNLSSFPDEEVMDQLEVLLSDEQIEGLMAMLDATCCSLAVYGFEEFKTQWDWFISAIDVLKNP